VIPMVEEYIKEMIRKINEKAASDPKFEQELKGIRKVVLVVVTDGDSYNFILENARVGPMSKGTVQNPDIMIAGAKETYDQLKSGELRPMKAYATRKLQVKGSLEDILRLRKFF
jgi:putative sterol carrier protein